MKPTAKSLKTSSLKPPKQLALGYGAHAVLEGGGGKPKPFFAWVRDTQIEGNAKAVFMWLPDRPRTVARNLFVRLFNSSKEQVHGAFGPSIRHSSCTPWRLQSDISTSKY